MPEGTLSLSSADRRHIIFVYFEKKRNFRKTTGSSLRDFESRCDKSRDNWDFLWGDFILANQGVPIGRMSHVWVEQSRKIWDEMYLSANRMSANQPIAKQHGWNWLLKDNLSIILPKSASIDCNYAWSNPWEVSIIMKNIFIYTHIIYISLMYTYILDHGNIYSMTTSQYLLS